MQNDAEGRPRPKTTEEIKVIVGDILKLLHGHNMSAADMVKTLLLTVQGIRMVVKKKADELEQASKRNSPMRRK